jgi:hypothetical protein
MTTKRSNKNLRNADKAKKDEFFTQLSNIEKELGYYKEYFKGKVIFCNCDDPAESNFWEYFKLNFKFLGLKKLVATHYEEEKPSYKLELARGEPDTIKTELKQNGDFRSSECIEILKEADIVVTNPPFSLFREYVTQLIEYDKKFIIIGNQNAITYKEIFKLLKENKIWLGRNIHGANMEFRVPEEYPLNSASSRIDENGSKFLTVSGVIWYTNLDIKKRHEDMILYKKYKKNEYPTYDNYEAINVDKTKDIPMDYRGVMGVPITFMMKYNPEQFELMGIMNTGEKNEGIRNKGTPHGRPLVNGVELYLRILIKSKGI